MKPFKLVVVLLIGTLFSLPVFAGPKKIKFTNDEIRCLALNMYYEARDQGDAGQIAVAFVTINRVQSGLYPKTVCNVVWQPNQFSWTLTNNGDAPSEEQAWKKALKLAKYFTKNYKTIADPTNGSLNYYAHELVNPTWATSMKVTYVIGGHTFGTAGRYR